MENVLGWQQAQSGNSVSAMDYFLGVSRMEPFCEMGKVLLVNISGFLWVLGGGGVKGVVGKTRLLAWEEVWSCSGSL